MAKKFLKTFNQNQPVDLLEKRKMADLIVNQLKSSFGPGAILKMSEFSLNEDLEVISTGSLAIDIASGVGGFPKGRIIEIYGPESSGKTSLALSTIAQAQKNGGIAAFIDAEHAFDPSWASKFGVQVEDLYISQPSSGEEALEIVDNLVRSNAFDIIVVDSVAALVPRSEIEGNMGDASLGVQARLMSQALRKLTGIISKTNTVVIFINQIRLKIGVVFGNPETTTGGQALKFYASQRCDVRKIANLKSGEKSIGIRIRVKFVKNKMAPPFQIAEVDLIPDEPGIFNLAGEIIDFGIEFGIIKKSGNTYSLTYNQDGLEIKEEADYIKLGVGRAKAVESLQKMQNLQIYKNIIFEKFKEKAINLTSKKSEDGFEEDLETEILEEESESLENL